MQGAEGLQPVSAACRLRLRVRLSRGVRNPSTAKREAASGQSLLPRREDVAHGFHRDGVKRSAGGDVEDLVARAAEGDVGGLLGELDDAERLALGVEVLEADDRGDVEVALGVDGQAVAAGVISKSQAEELVIVCGVFIHWEAKDDNKIYQFNYEATKLSIERAMKGDPKIEEILSKKDTAKHPYSPK